jgi:hypothetical protein
MTDKIINLSVHVELVPGGASDDSGGDAGKALEWRRRAMLENLHGVLIQHCPGLTLPALEQMIGSNTFGEILDRLAISKLLEHPQGRA